MKWSCRVARERLSGKSERRSEWLVRDGGSYTRWLTQTSLALALVGLLGRDFLVRES